MMLINRICHDVFLNMEDVKKIMTTMQLRLMLISQWNYRVIKTNIMIKKNKIKKKCQKDLESQVKLAKVKNYVELIIILVLV